MIDLATATKQLASLDDRGLRAAVAKAIFEGRQVVGQMFRDAQPEDIFAPILAFPEAPRRQIVLSGCRDVGNRFFAALNDLAAGDPSPEPDLAEAADHFSALLNTSRPAELQIQVRSLFEAAMHPAIDNFIRGPFADLAVSYASIDPRPKYWQDLLNGNVVPGQAFQALRHIDPHDPRLEGFLAQLWRRALRGEISLRMPFIVDAWAKQQPSPQEAVRKVVRATFVGEPALEDALRSDCGRYPHSASWVQWIPSSTVIVPFAIGTSDFGSKVSIDKSVTRIGPQANQSALAGVQSSLTRIGNSGAFTIENIVTKDNSQIVHAAAYATEVLKSYRLLFVEYPYNDALDDFVRAVMERTSSNLSAQIGESQQQLRRNVRA